MTPSAVSRQIKALEREFVVPLFSRQPNGVELTPEGQDLYAVLSSGFARASEVVHRIKTRALSRQISIGHFQRRTWPSASVICEKNKNNGAPARPSARAGSIEFTLTMPSLGRSEDPWRTSQARHRRRPNLSRQIHGEAQETAFPGLEDVPAQSC